MARVPGALSTPVACTAQYQPVWTELDKKLLTQLNPSGYFEHVEIGCPGMSDHIPLPKDHVFYTRAGGFYEAGDRMGQPFTICLDGESKRHIKEAGFVDVQETRLKLPVGGWLKDSPLEHVEMLLHCSLERDMEGSSMFVCN